MSELILQVRPLTRIVTIWFLIVLLNSKTYMYIYYHISKCSLKMPPQTKPKMNGFVINGKEVRSHGKTITLVGGPANGEGDGLQSMLDPQ